MIVKVVDESGKPIINANGYYRFNNYINFQVDENGVIEIPMPAQGSDLRTADITILAEGYGPYSAMFRSDPTIPEIFTAVLKPAQRIGGGVVVDEDRNPVEGVNVELSIRFETAYKTADIFVTSVDTKTDAQGKWSLFHLPTTFNGSPSLSLEKQGYLLTPIYDVPVAKLNPDAQGNYNERLTIEKGYRFPGRIVNENGSPIKDATVQLSSDFRSLGEPQNTNGNGLFSFENCSLNDRVLLTVKASGKAAHAQWVEIRSEENPIQITMTPGRKITFEIVDSAGQPVPEVSVNINHINGMPGGHYHLQTKMIQEKTDDTGKIIWNEGPGVPFDFSCSKKDYSGVENRAKIDQDTIRITLYRSKINLKIVDDDTGEPIPAFTVMTRVYENEDSERYNFSFSPTSGSNGLKETHFNDRHGRACHFDVEAPGYEKQSSRKVKYGEENLELEIRLVRSSQPQETTAKDETEIADVASEPLFPLSGGKVLTPEDVPAVNATVEVVVPESICVVDAKPVHTNENGEFLLSDDQWQTIGPQNFVLKITHPSGAIAFEGSEFRKRCDIHSDKDAQAITLQRWGRIEGTLICGTKTLEGTSVSASWEKPDSLSAHPRFYSATGTKKEGRFVLEQVFPGTISINRYISAERGPFLWSTYYGTVEVAPGETVRCTIGGTGRAVVGKAVVVTDLEDVDFTKYTARLVKKPENPDDLTAPELPSEYQFDRNRSQDDQFSCNLRQLRWYQTPEGARYQEQLKRYLKATNNIRFNVLRSDGTFRFDDLPDGDYTLVISKTENCGLDCVVGPLHYHGFFTVDQSPQTKAPLKLGELTLKKLD